MNDELTGTKQKGEIEKELYTIREEEEKKRKDIADRKILI